MEFWLRKQSNEDEENLCVWSDSFLNSLLLDPVRFVSVRLTVSTLGLGIHSSVLSVIRLRFFEGIKFNSIRIFLNFNSGFKFLPDSV